MRTFTITESGQSHPDNAGGGQNQDYQTWCYEIKYTQGEGRSGATKEATRLLAQVQER